MADSSVEHIYSHAKYGDSDYDKKEDCEWVIEANEGRRIRSSAPTGSGQSRAGPGPEAGRLLLRRGSMPKGPQSSDIDVCLWCEQTASACTTSWVRTWTVRRFRGAPLAAAARGFGRLVLPGGRVREREREMVLSGGGGGGGGGGDGKAGGSVKDGDGSGPFWMF